jgi:primosomal protein N' (replication factor Y)
VQQRLTGEIAARGLVGETIVGPAPAFIPRLRGRYRWQLIIKERDPCRVLNGMDLPSGWVTDVDPVGL